MFINFADIPGHQNLFLDYLYEFENVKKFYGSNFRDVDSYKNIFERLASYKRPHKDKLVDIIEGQYSNKKLSKQTELNIESLRSSKTIAVVTGQQLGIVGGPLYTFYKTITAIKLCASLKEKYDDYKFVPVFWMEGDDHDFDEVRSLKILDQSNSLKNISYDDGLDEETNRGSIADLKFNNNIYDFFNELRDSLRDTEFKKDLIEFLKDFYKPDKTFRESFFDLLFNLFDDSGLVIFNPADPKVKDLLKPVFKKEIENFRVHSEDVVMVSAELEDIYHAQIKIKPINIFLKEDEGRFLLEPVDSEFRLKGKRKKLTKEQLLNLLEEDPSKFSPNVLLRPVCQDYLFPTGFYIGGPSEISYFAQVIPMYKPFGLTVPIIYPRSSVTILENNIQKVINKYDLNIRDFFSDEQLLNSRIISLLSDIEIDPIFVNVKEKINELVDQLKNEIAEVDKTLEDAADKTGDKLQQTIDQLKGKAEKARERKHDTVLRQVDKVRTLVYPNGNLQERELNFIYFTHKYGLDILKWIFDQVSINKFEHQVIEM